MNPDGLLQDAVFHRDRVPSFLYGPDDVFKIIKSFRKKAFPNVKSTGLNIDGIENLMICLMP